MWRRSSFSRAMRQARNKGRLDQHLGRAGAAVEPDVIVTIDQDFAATVRTDPVWAPVKAVKDGRIHLSPKMPFGWVDFPRASIA